MYHCHTKDIKPLFTFLNGTMVSIHTHGGGCLHTKEGNMFNICRLFYLTWIYWFFSSNLIFCLFIDFHFPPLSSSPLPLWRLNAIDIAPNNIIKIIVPICAQKDKRRHLWAHCLSHYAVQEGVSISRVNHNDGVFASRETSVLGRFLSSGGHLRLWPVKTITYSVF